MPLLPQSHPWFPPRALVKTRSRENCLSTQRLAGLALQDVRGVPSQVESDGGRVNGGDVGGRSVLQKPVALAGRVARGSSRVRGIGAWHRDVEMQPVAVVGLGAGVIDDLFNCVGVGVCPDGN